MKILVIAFVLLSQVTIGQLVFRLTPKNQVISQLDSSLSDYRIFEFDESVLFDTNLRNEKLTLRLFLDSTEYHFNFEQNKLFGEGIQVRNTLGQSRNASDINLQCYHGNIVNSENSYATLTLFNSSFILHFVEDGKGFYLEDLSRLSPGFAQNSYVLYDVSAIKKNGTSRCYLMGMQKAQVKIDMPKSMMPPTDGCQTLRFAIATDYSIFQIFDSSDGVVAFVTGVLNDVQTNYDYEFDYTVDFEIVDFFISDCSSCDEWTTSTDGEVLLADFRDWGNDGNFGVTFDVGQFWTNRNFQYEGNYNTVGLAYIDGLCGSSKYQILEHFTTLSEELRVLVAHELGHNFGAQHDAEGSSYIMSPTVSTSNDWSGASENEINSKLSTGCLMNCDFIWVDYAYPGIENGSFQNPFDTLIEGVNSVDSGGTIMIKASSSGETITIETPCKIRSWNGTATTGN